MGLIKPQKVKIKWYPKTKKHYEELGYTYTKMGDYFEIKVEDLTEGSNTKVECICDNCNEKFEILYKSYNHNKKIDKIYCHKCAMKLYGIENIKKIKLDKSKSIAQWLIEEYGENALDLYWDYDKNTTDPWKISRGSSEKVWIKCQEKEYHNSYKISCNNFINGKRCPYCANRNGKVHPLDSLKQYIINKYGEEFFNIIWSDKNTIDPSTIPPNSTIKCWWNCPDGKHESFQRICCNSNTRDFRCPKCVEENNVSIYEEKTKQYLKRIGYRIYTEYQCTIKPINPETKQPLPFDNEIVLENGKHLIIEVHGEQHYKIDGLYIKTKEELEYQQRKDRYKKEKCLELGYEYLEIPYTAFNKEETYKILIDDKIINCLSET